MQELATAFGEWVEKERRLTIETYMAKNRGAAATSSRRASNGLYWLPSGAGHLNYLALNEVVYVFFFSEVSCPGPAPIMCIAHDRQLAFVTVCLLFEAGINSTAE